MLAATNVIFQRQPRLRTLAAGPAASMNGVLRPSNCRVEGVVFVDPIQVRNPWAHWTTLMLFPLSDPLVAWLLGVLGFVGVLAKRYQQQAGGPLS
jgi:hypothetical protein